MKKWLKRTLIIGGSIIGGLGLILGGGFLTLHLLRTGRVNEDPEHVEPIVEGNTLVFAKNRSLYDKNGDILRLKGANAGNLLVTEGWISPYSCGPLTNPDGTPKTDRDGNVEYPELTQEDVEKALRENTTLTPEQKTKLIDIYRANWFSEDDFRIMKEDFGMNAVRLPFYWRNILNDDWSRKSEEEAFTYLDWFMEQCTRHQLYVILDLHGAPKTQNGYEHSGIISEDMLWNDDKAIEATCDLWAYVAEHYKDNPLGDIIATYDLLNEPCGDYKGATQDNCYPVFNRIYQAIRNTGDNHVITIEGCWMFDKFVDPNVYNWTNIQYQIHLYCWDWLGIDMDTYYTALEATRLGHDYNVPYLVGEFTFFQEDYATWEKWLGYYDKIGYSWTLWTYKKTVVGWWNDNWGLMNYKMYLNNKTHEQKPDLRTADYATLKSVFEECNSTNCDMSTAGKNVAKYLKEHK